MDILVKGSNQHGKWVRFKMGVNTYTAWLKLRKVSRRATNRADGAVWSFDQFTQLTGMDPVSFFAEKAK